MLGGVLALSFRVHVLVGQMMWMLSPYHHDTCISLNDVTLTIIYLSSIVHGISDAMISKKSISTLLFTPVRSIA